VNPLRSSIVALVGLVAALVLAPAAASASDSCPRGFDCFDVPVPLDRSGAINGTVDLPVMVQRGDEPVMLALGGGPGQGMTRVAEPIAELLSTLTGHRIAVLDQRGTGDVALHCPAMQDAALTDFTVPPRGTVEACGDALGDTRGLYSTTATVADLEDVRAALGVEQVALFGVSYGTYTAERYARAFPDRVLSLVLDSVVPQQNVDPFLAANMSGVGRVLDQLCTKRSRCAEATDDPVRDLRRLVRRTNSDAIPAAVKVGGERVRARIDGPALVDLATGLSSFFQNKLARLPSAIKAALRERPKRLVAMYRDYREKNYTPDPADLSWGLHTATICADVPFPWGSAASDPASRPAAAEAALAALPPGSWGPFGADTAVRNGLLRTCERWPATNVAPPPEPGPLPAVPTLILAGTWDLSTPIQDARTEARRSPDATFAKLHELGHSTVTSAECAQDAVLRFYAEKAIGRPCKGHRAPRR
jgi:pimeloyl-ACP methyl ester carboxylesterase